MHFTEISTCIVNSVSVLLFLPLWVILIILLNSLCPLINSKRLTFNLSISTSLINLFFSIICLIFCIKNPSINIENNIIWLNSDVKVFLGTLVDNLSSVFLILYSIIFFLIQIFSYFKIKDTKNFHKFFIYLNLANFSIIGLILSTNLIQTLIFIIFTSVVCYLTMSCFSLEEQSELVVRKIFLLNYFGDISLLIGISVIVYFSSLFNVSQNLILLSYSDFIFHVDNFYSMFSEYTYVVILLFMLISIFIKMGQVPFFSSVLKLNEIKNLGAIIVLFCLSLGSIYLLARIYPMIILSVFVKNILIVVGMLSAFLGVYFSLSQNLLNKFLLSLGVSQFGLILLTIGLKGYSLAIYSYWVFLFAYLLLFFISYLLNKDGSINIKNTNGIRKDYPILAILYGVSSLSICGLSFGGFYCQHSLFSLIYETQQSWLIAGYLFVIFLTSFALSRVYFLIFEGEKTNTEKIDYSFKFLTIPILFGIIIILSGALKNNFNDFIYFIKPENILSLLTVSFFIQLFVVVGAIYLAFVLYLLQDSMFMKIKENILNKNYLIYKLSYEFLYLDKVCEFFQQISLKLCKIINIFEKIGEGISFAIIITSNILSKLFKKIQKLNFQSCILLIFIIVTIIMILIFIAYFIISFMGV